MRPIRLLLSLLACILTFTILLYHGTARSSTSADRQESRMSAYFSWRTPSSLFPPSAVISLTDDNSTFFLARPAAFGPSLPAKSLSGQLWIGSGFGDDNLGRNGPGSSLEGELGCSDVPGWSNGESRKSWAEGSRSSRAAKEHTRTRVSEMAIGMGDDGVGTGFTASIESVMSDDGTDDHLLAASAGSDAAANRNKQQAAKISHADIQSLQESAEIAGKIVLLTRGGCGFLDKVKWAQRRGAVAVIIGDDIRGGPLVTMYARGDTSNVTIAALFTSHTTAHLLSSLMPQGNKTARLPDETRLGVAIGDGVKSAKKNKPKSRPAPAMNKARQAPVKARSEFTQPVSREKDAGPGWFWAMFGAENSRYPRSETVSGSDWVLQTDFDETEGIDGVKASSKPATHDGFEIGVHDWRDADMVAEQKERIAQAAEESAKTSKSSKEKSKSNGDRKQGKTSKGWLNKLISGKKEDSKTTPTPPAGATIVDLAPPISNPVHLHDIHIPGAMYDEITEHEGLWVTLTPTSMSSSPFIDTLLVLVVSPLVTLTVVYALLLLRSRIRRRRWRAPKSVVERLPVRTYQTMTSPPTSSTSSAVSTPNANTPLLSGTSPRSIRPRPRSRTDSQVPIQAGSSVQSLDTEEEKREAGLSEWRRKYGGKQKECVVCLEEYIDGVSRVMSLPCGHEFHEGCITPWLTTRRRTCPICKGDVVRSLARSQGSMSSSPHNVVEVGEEDELQQQVAMLTNDDPASQRPISRDEESFQDLERGIAGQVDRDR